MPEEMADGGRRLVTLDDLIDALDKRETAPSNVPKVETFHFKGDKVSNWLDLTEQALVGQSDEVKLQRVLRYVLHSHHREVTKVVDVAGGSWKKFGDLMRRKYRLGDGLLTMADLEAMNKEDFSTIGAFVYEFKKKARKVHEISEEAQCATFLGLLTGSEATELTKYGEGSERLTWATIDKRVEEGSLDQVEQHQMRLQRRKRKERDATASGTPGVKRIVTDVLATLGYQERLRVMCEEAQEWEMNLPEVMLYGSGPESSSGPQGCPSVATAGAGPRSGMTFRPPTSHGRVPQAVQTRGQSKATAGQGPSQAPGRAPPGKEPEPERTKEVVEVQEEEDEGDDEEDERLRQEEDRRAKQRAKKRGIQGGAEPSLHDGAPKRKKYAVRLEEGFDVRDQPSIAMVDTGAEMNIIRERDATMLGLEVDHSDHGVLHGANYKAIFCGTASNVMVEIGRVRARTCFFVMPDVDHPILLGRSFLCRTETLVINRHEGTMILALSDPACGNYEIIKCRNTGPGSARNRLNLGSFTFEESEYARRRLREEQEEEGAGEVLSLSLNDVNKAMEVVAAYDMADPEAIKALREQAGPCRINNENEEGLIIGEPGFLSPQERTLMVGTMKRRHCAYAFNDDERGRLDVDKIPMIRIHTVPHESWNLRGARYPNPDEGKKVVDYLDGKMRTYVADYSSGPYASPWFCFIKPNGTLRWVQDLQRLNAVTVRDAGGLPNADALSESCAGRPIISLIDLFSGYDQFPVYPPDRPVTAMHTPRGLIHMNVAPQGWTNAVAMVQRHMIRAMQTVSPHITQPYIDDLAVKGPKEKEEDEVMPGVRRFVLKHVQDIDQVLGLLEEHNLTASGPKSKHCMRETTILGFVCNEKGRRPDVKKTDKILEWPVPFQSITDVRSFLGTCGFWRSFVKDFATKTEHLRKLVCQYQEWVWGKDQEKVVERMKREFKEGGLVLGAPNYEATEEKPFVVETDAGPTALGGFKKETLAVLHCLRTFRNYIFGRRLILRVDPTALACSLKSYTPSDPTIARWLIYIWMFNFELERIPGDKNRADGLSRINWDGANQESIEDTPPVDGFLDQEEDVRLHINEWSLRVPSCVTHPIWLAPRGYEQKEELVLEPFQEEDPWGSRDVGWMMKLALAGTHSLAEEVRTIEEGSTQVEEHEQLMRGMYLLTNTLLQRNFNQRSSAGSKESELLIPESQDDEFEDGEIREAFRAEEYDGIYRKLGLLLSCEIRDRDASEKAQKMRHLYVVRDGHLFIKRQVGNPKRIVCGRNRQIDVIAALHDGIAGGHRGVSATCAKISELYHWDGMLTMVIKYCQSCVPCQQRSTQRPREPLHPRLEREVGAVVHLDLLFMPLGEDENNYIFDARDNLTGFVDGRTIRTKTGPVLAKCIEEYYLRYPFVREFVMDRGSEFTCNEAVMQRGGRDTRPCQGLQRIAGGGEQHEPPRREPTLEFDDDNIELFLDVYRDHAAQRGWSVAERIHHLRGVGRLEEPVAQICEEALAWQDVEAGMQRLRASPRGHDGMPIRLEEGNAEEFIPAYEHYMLSQGIAREECVQALLIWTRGAERPVAKQIWERARDWEDCQAQLRRTFGRPECEGHEPRVERRRRSKRPREPTPREVGLARERGRAPAQREGEPAGPALAEESFPACGLRAVEFRRITGEELRPPSPLPSAQEQDIRRETPFRSLATHLDASRWEASRLGEGSVEPTCYVSLEEPLDPETETDMRDREEPQDPEMAVEQPDPVWPQGGEVITDGDDTPPRSPVPEPAQYGQRGFPSQAESLMAMSTERRGSRLHELAAAMGIGTPQEGPQRCDAPEHVPRLGELRAELGSWATGRDSGGSDSERQQQQGVTSEPATMAGSQLSGSCGDEAVIVTERPLEEGPQELRLVGTAVRGSEGAEAMEPEPQGHMGLPSCHEVTTEAVGAPSASSSQGRKKKTARWHDTSCFWCKKEGHRAMDCPELLEDKAEGRVAEVDGKFYDRQGRIVERAPDGGRARLYRQNQEELCK
ncbi:hypothetical protein CBR_g42107 [Chara braunii]|uniref:CCHC-type domain-containing protein n=1 Tax=Chara braunii TaxID=69332 RepID=A0A388LWX4_CHABU|nr:hypothetical protein CBR_g42107 [Chara braunii]|eukprot:GBG86824.1 hypothetical protein CBR_g42107 [Chara braunii]